MSDSKTYLNALLKTDNLLCLGLDPVLSRFPSELGNGIEAVSQFLDTILERAQDEDILPSTLKPNLAYFEQFGWQGWKLLEEMVEKWSSHCLIVLDAKRGDIGRSSDAYAKACFDTLKGDSVTLHPWMGPESIEPFTRHFPEKGGYLLLRTSNPGSDLLQGENWKDLMNSIESWDQSGSLGFVVGATRPEELEWVLKNDKRNRPLLIPGVGTQGGSASEMIRILSTCDEPRHHRVNVSSAILYAHEQPGGQFPESNLEALRRFRNDLTLRG